MTGTSNYSEEKTTTKEIKIMIVIALLLGAFLGGFGVSIWKQARIDTLKIACAKKTITAYKFRELEDVEYKIVEHRYDIPGIIDDQFSYWSFDYLIKVFRVGDTYYIKVYVEWEGL